MSVCGFFSALKVLSRKYLEEEERLTRDDLHTTSNGSDASEKKQENYDAFLGTTRLSYVVRQGVTFCVSVGQLESDTFHSFFPQQETSQEVRRQSHTVLKFVCVVFLFCVS